jgi:DNA-binding CsgD family transcriptional regulator
MTGPQFRQWLAAMKAAGLGRSDAECARLLDCHVNTLLRYKKGGADRQTALACRALLHRLEPYP